MIQESSALGSRIAPVLVLAPAAARDLDEQLIRPLLTRFFSARGTDHWAEIPPEDLFHDLEFQGTNAVPIVQLYTALFARLARDTNKRLVHVVRFAFLLDEEGLTERCSETGVRFLTLRLANRPVGYLIGFPLARVLKHLRTHVNRICDPGV
jgi:hypothetical protein